MLLFQPSISIFQVVSDSNDATQQCTLMQATGINGSFKAVTSMQFLSSSPVGGLALAGEPGATGIFHIETMQGSELTSPLKAGSERLALDVPFRLRSCFLGYKKTSVNVKCDNFCALKAFFSPS